MLHNPSGAGLSDDASPKVGIPSGTRRRPLVPGLMAVLAFGLFNIGALAQSHAPITFHGEGSFAETTSFSSTSTTSTFADISVSRNVQEGNGSGPIVTTNVSYAVCVLTFSTNVEVCQNGYGAIANSELTGDVNYGLDTVPTTLTLNFDSATETGFLLYAYQCDSNGQNCSDVTPSGGLVTVNWKKNGLSSTTNTGTSRETFFNRLTFISVGQSRSFSADSSGSIAGTSFTGDLYPNTIGSVRNFTFSVVFGGQ